jgi:hypothetical protein
VSEDIFEVLLSQFGRPGTSLVYFRMVGDSDQLFVKASYKMADLYARLAGRLGTSQGSAPLISVRRSVFLAVHGFNETMKAAEDVDFIHRVGRHMGGVRSSTRVV